MRIAIFVYQSTQLNISTNESGLQLCGMDAGDVPLQEGPSAHTLSPGIYKIVSNQDVLITGDTSTFDLNVTTFTKTNHPDLVPPRATATFASLDSYAVLAFMTVPEAKSLANP